MTRRPIIPKKSDTPSAWVEGDLDYPQLHSRMIALLSAIEQTGLKS